jgi:hypothetical protein
VAELYRADARAPGLTTIRKGDGVPLKVMIAIMMLGALAACYDGPNLRDCSEWRTRSIAGCYDGQGGVN